MSNLRTPWYRRWWAYVTLAFTAIIGTLFAVALSMERAKGNLKKAQEKDKKKLDQELERVGDKNKLVIENIGLESQLEKERLAHAHEERLAGIKKDSQDAAARVPDADLPVALLDSLKGAASKL